MRNIVLVWIGGGFGAVLRYLLSGFAQQTAGATLFPVGTVVVNVIGCFAAGVLSQLAEDHGLFKAGMRTFLFVGVLGGFTTFSAFANETINLFRQSETMPAGLNIGLHIILCLGAVWAGRAFAYLVWR